MKTFALTLASFLALAANTANAADFNGPYVGGSVGLDKTNYKTEGFWNDDTSTSGADIGIQAGYQKTYGKLVLGGEVGFDYSFANNDRTIDVSHGRTLGLKARPGYLLNDKTALFGSAGVAWSDFRYGDQIVKENQVGQFGYTLGAGIETYLNQNWSVRADYEHGFYNSFTTQDGLKVDPASDLIKAGVSYHW